jgi:Sulfotransferase family
MENGMIDDALLVTGMLRSGTTLLEKLLSTQTRFSMLSQPFPLLFVEAKRAFLRSLTVEDERYPLGHLFLETRYDSEALAAFLMKWRTSPADLTRLFESMRGYSGQQTRVTEQRLAQAILQIEADDDFAEVVRKLDRLLGSQEGASIFGSKETFCEELVPFLLDRGFRCAVILRDPRDVITSLNAGRGREYGGEIKPALFNVRSWRKSVATALALEGQRRFHWCRYEDLVADPAATLTRLAAALDLGPLDPSRFQELRNADGSVWRGNSSFQSHVGVSAGSVGSYRTELSPGPARFVEACTLPELRLLGYETGMTADDALNIVDHFREPGTTERTGMERDLATPENAAVERQRLERLTGARRGHSRRWFLFDRTETRLREALGS